MTFEEWHNACASCCEKCASSCPHVKWERKAWNAAVAEERELCSKAVCYWCRKVGLPTKDGAGNWWHYAEDADGTNNLCEATAIREQQP